MATTAPPAHAKVLVVGGGPAGSYAATVLAREGVDVVLLETAHFPRYHIGESLIPSVRHYLRFVGAEEKVENYGFCVKPGAGFKLNQHKGEGYTDFFAMGPKSNAWNVPRAEFDKLLLDHARESGVKVFEGAKVVQFEAKDGNLKAATGDGSDASQLGQPVAATYTLDESYGGDKSEHRITFDYVVDASGRAGLLSTKYMKNRKFTESLKNVAMWGYWRNTSKYMAGTGLNRENAAYFEALTDESGWAWFIPLHNGVTSVGIVMNQNMYNERVKNTGLSGASMIERYKAFLPLAPHVVEIIADGKMVTDGSGPDERGVMREYPPVKMAGDFSYNATCYGGEGWRVAGDAGAFIDPFFSSGVHLAFTGGLSAAATIAASIRGDCDERIAAEYHSQRVGISYTRFLVVVLSAYKQMRAQSAAVLSDVEEGDFNRAFGAIRAVIQGAGDMGKRLSSNELDGAIDFCGKLFENKTPEEQRREAEEAKKADMDAVSQQGSMAKDEGKDEDSEVRERLKKVNAAQRSMQSMHDDRFIGTSNFEEEPLEISGHGYAVRLRQGELGLVGKY